LFYGNKDNDRSWYCKIFFNYWLSI